MPIGDAVDETGLVLQDGRRIILRVDDGGEWELDFPRGYSEYLGRRARISGQRSGRLGMKLTLPPVEFRPKLMP